MMITIDGNVLTSIYDVYTGTNVNYQKVTLWYDGSSMTDSKCDGVIYRKYNSQYWKRAYDGELNVKWFGAKGDNVNDDTAALKNAFAFVSMTGGKLYIPSGNYHCTDILKISSSNVSVYGDGESTRIIAYNPTQTEDAALSVICVNYKTDYLSATKRISNIVIRDFVIDQTNITPVFLPKWDWSSPSGLPAYYGVRPSAIGISAVDHFKALNVTVVEGVLGGFSESGCYDAIFDNCNVFGLRCVRFSSNPALTYNGNCFTFGGTSNGNISTGSLNTYTGPIGEVKAVNCTAIGKNGTFPDQNIYANLFDDAANIGFDVPTGSIGPTQRVAKNFLISNCTAQKCIYGIMIEGLNDGGTGDLSVQGNSVNGCLVGIALYGNTTTNLDNTNDVIISNNKITNSYFNGILGCGNNALIAANFIENWGTYQTGGYLDSFSTSGLCCAIEWIPFGVNVTAPLTARGLTITNNHCINKFVNDNTFFKPVSGIYLHTLANDQVLRDVIISDNYFNGGNATNSNSNKACGISIFGRFDDLTITNNIITGFPSHAVYLGSSSSSDSKQSPSKVRIANFKFYDNNKSGANPIECIKIQTTNDLFTIENGDIYETGTSHIWCIVTLFDIPNNNSNNIPSTSGHITIRNIKVNNLAYGNENCVNIATSGTNVRIENILDYNYRTAPSSSYPAYQGTVIWNKNPSSNNISHWMCVASGTPGTWVPVYIDPQILNGALSLAFPSTPAQSSSSLTITVPGAADGDSVALGIPSVASYSFGLYFARVSSANTVVVTFVNFGTTAYTPASGTFKVRVIK